MMYLPWNTGWTKMWRFGWGGGNSYRIFSRKAMNFFKIMGKQWKGNESIKGCAQFLSPQICFIHEILCLIKHRYYSPGHWFKICTPLIPHLYPPLAEPLQSHSIGRSCQFYLLNISQISSSSSWLLSESESHLLLFGPVQHSGCQPPFINLLNLSSCLHTLDRIEWVMEKANVITLLSL